MNYFQLIKELQTHFFRQVSGYANYKYNPRMTDLKMIVRFVNWGRNNYKGQFGADFLIKYFEFQYSYYSGLKTRFGKGVVMINWIIGDKAIKRYETRDIKNNRYAKFFLNKNSSEYFKKQSLNLSERRQEKLKIKEKYVLEVHPIEEQFKQSFFNTEKGFVFCCTTTTLFNLKSDLCKKCDFAKQCKETLQANYPLIYKLRKEHGEIG